MQIAASGASAREKSGDLKGRSEFEGESLKGEVQNRSSRVMGVSVSDL
jgi:hypothetical protein